MTGSLLLGLTFCLLIGAAPRVDLVYPRIEHPDSIARHDRVDSTFLFGTVSPAGARLIINDREVATEEDGAFIAYLPIDWTSKRWRLTAVHGLDSSALDLKFNVRQAAPSRALSEVKFPATIRLNGGALRNHPNGAYYLFADPGTIVIADGRQDGYFRIPITPQRSVWAPAAAAEPAPKEVIPSPVLHRLALRPAREWVDLLIPTGGRILYRAEAGDSPRVLHLDLFGALSHIDRVDYPPHTGMIREVRWDQPAERQVRLSVELAENCWGYQVWWEADNMVLSVRRPPDLRRGLAGLVIAVDAGHGGTQPGAVGPRRTLEKEVNLAVAEALRQELQSAGASVVMTREGDQTLELARRVEIAREGASDLLISLHHNALPDGVNPFGRLGVGVHYYQPFSRALADCVQRSLCAALQLPDEGVYYHNLALVRPTAMPAILVEAAYIMLPAQESLLRNSGYAAACAAAVRRGIEEFIRSRSADQGDR